MASDKPTGRPTKCTPEVTAIICKHVAEGLPKRYACSKADVTYRQMLEWEERGKEGEEPFLTFARELDKAKTEHVEARLEAMRLAPSKGGDWKREAWLLERLHPKEFGQLTKTQISGPDGGPVQTQASVVIVPADAPTLAAWAATVTTKPRDAGD